MTEIPVGTMICIRFWSCFALSLFQTHSESNKRFHKSIYTKHLTRPYYIYVTICHISFKYLQELTNISFSKTFFGYHSSYGLVHAYNLLLSSLLYFCFERKSRLSLIIMTRIIEYMYDVYYVLCVFFSVCGQYQFH